MDADIITLIWLAVGLLLIGIEFFVPGLVVVFLGLGAVLTAGLRFLGVIDSLPASLVTFMASSVAMVFGLRGTIRKWFPPEESKYDDNEVMRAYGSEVLVVEDVHELGDGAPAGRIRFEGTSWPAATTSGVIKKGSKARLVVRENLAWLVEPIEQLLDAPRDERVPVEGARQKKDGEET